MEDMDTTATDSATAKRTFEQSEAYDLLEAAAHFFPDQASVSPQQLSKLHGVPLSTIYFWIKSGVLPSLKMPTTGHGVRPMLRIPIPTKGGPNLAARP